MSNKTEALDLYAKIEDMLHNSEAISSLYSLYLKKLDKIEFDSFLDVGCGSGGFLELIQSVFSPKTIKGIDLSPVMVSRTTERGIDAEVVGLCDLHESYDVITAVFDMLNYLDKAELDKFTSSVLNSLNDGGYFICDINTEYGFDQIASGSFTAEDEKQYLIIDSYYDNAIYSSYFTLFEKVGNLYRRSDEKIVQYLHIVDEISENNSLRLISRDFVTLYGDEADKILLIFKKE
ncbi:MAG: class I SAM-dependent methyltransferase [Sulfurovum sp.]|nr:class I SAM-dependent methyltransferase [Sulfurovum sp.]